MGDKHNPMKKVERAKKCMNCIKKCGIVWMILAVLVFIVGILLLVFFGQYISESENWRQGVGITGVVFLIVGLLAFAVAVFLIWAFCHLINRQQASGSMASGGIKHKYHLNSHPDDLYPRQKGFQPLTGSPHHMAGGYPGGETQPSAPEKQPEPVSPDAITIETDGKY